jgi:hypothetical protein
MTIATYMKFVFFKNDLQCIYQPKANMPMDNIRGFPIKKGGKDVCVLDEAK